MKTQKRAPISWIPILALLIVAGSFSCHRSGSGNHPSSLDDHLASRLLGRHVENEDGQELARLDDLLLDLKPGRAEFGLLASDGFLGLGKHLKIVPCQALSTRTTKRDVLALDITRPGWQNAPVLKSKAALPLKDPVMAKIVKRYYEIAASENDAILPPAAAPPQPRVPAPTGHDSRTGWPIDSARTLKSVRALTGDAVVNRRQQRIGRIVDFLVDLTGRRISYAIVSADPLLRRRERFAIPLALLSQGEGSTFVVDASPSIFEQAQSFDPTNWQNNRMEFGKILRFSTENPAHIVSPSEPENVLTAL
jgi:sporulation protein YlmC with PRC-barrel domain